MEQWAGPAMSELYPPAKVSSLAHRGDSLEHLLRRGKYSQTTSRNGGQKWFPEAQVQSGRGFAGLPLLSHGPREA